MRGSECLLDKDQTMLEIDPCYVFATTACHILLSDLVLFLSYLVIYLFVHDFLVCTHFPCPHSTRLAPHILIGCHTLYSTVYLLSEQCSASYRTTGSFWTEDASAGAASLLRRSSAGPF